MIKAILTDIEGTTSAIAFVHDVLFPYARARLPGFVAAHGDEPEVAALLAQVAVEADRPLDREQSVAQLLAWMAEDRKATSLKALQGLIWAQGYASGDFQGHVYADAARRLRGWQAQGLKLYVYSSGSVHAQKLIFGHTTHGDLTPLFSGWFDTTSGHKREVESYRRIGAAIGLSAAEILFLSDIVEELDAARAAGLSTTQLVRGGTLDPRATHRQAADFDGVEV